MRSTQITIFHGLWLAVPACAFYAGSLGKQRFGWFAAVVFGLIAFMLGHIAWVWLMVHLRRSLMKDIERMTTEQLWDVVRLPVWNFTQTLALLQLGARHENVESQIPRILSMLVSDSRLERVYGWDALKLVFESKAHLIGEYDPEDSADICRQKVAPLLQKNA